MFPIDFASLFFGSMKIPFAKYFLASVLGIAPSNFFTILGDAAYDYIPMKLIVIGIICAIPIGAIYLIVKWIKDKKAKKIKLAIVNKRQQCYNIKMIELRYVYDI